MLIRLLIFSAFVLAVNLIAGIFAKELESDVEDWNQDDSSRMLHLISSQYLDSFGTGDISHSLKKPKINKRFAKDEANIEENTTEHRKVRKSISLRRRLQRNKSNEESLVAQESSHVLGATAQPETTTSRSHNDTATEEKSTEEKEADSSLNETKTTTESSESKTSSTTASASPAPRKRTRPPIIRTEAPPVPLAAAAAAALTMSESLYNHFRPLDKDVPEDHLLPFLDFGRKLIPSSKTSTSPHAKSSSSSSSTSSTNSIESATVAPSRSPSSLGASRYQISVHRKSNASVNSPSETTLDVRATTPREEEVHEDMDVSVVKPIVEKNKASRGRGSSAQFLRNLGGLYRKQDASSTTTITATSAEGNVTESTTVASKEAINHTIVSYSDSKEKISVEDQLARAQELPRYTITPKRTYSAKLVNTENDMSISETVTHRTVSNATASTSTFSQTSVPSKQWAASSSVIEATLPSPLLEKKRNVTSFMLLNRRPPLRGISVNRHNLHRNSSDETKSDSVSSTTVNQTLVPSEEKSESLNISARGKMSFKLLSQNSNKDYQAKHINATQTDLEATKTTPSAAPSASEMPQSSTTETTLVTSSPPSPTTKILSTAVVTSVSVKGAWPSSAVTNVPLPEPTLAPPDNQQSAVTSEKPATPPSTKDIPQSTNNSMIPSSEEILTRRTKNLTFPESVSSVEPLATTSAPNSSTIPSTEVTSMASTTEQINTTTTTISTTLKPKTTTLIGKLGSRRRVQLGVSSIAKHSSSSNNGNESAFGGSPTSTTQSSVVFTRSSKSPNHFRFPVFTTTRAPWRPSSTTTRSTSTSTTTTSTATTAVTAGLSPKVLFPTIRNQPSNTTLISTDLPSSVSPPENAPSSAETSPVSVRTITDTSEFDLPLWRLYNASTVLFPSSPGIKPAVTTVDSKQIPQESGEMEEAVVRKEMKNNSLSEVQNKTLENVTEGVILGASEVRPSSGVGVIVYVTAAVAIVPAIIIVALTTKYLLNKRKKLLDDSDAYSDISSRRDAVTTSCQQSESDLGSPISGTKLPRVPTHLTWDQEKPTNPGSAVTSSNWEFPRSKLRLQTVLGQGNFGQVLKAEADDICGHQGMTRLVAVKTVKEGASARETEDLLRELEIMQHLGSHTNVVTLLGCCTEKEPYLLIMEYVMYGKLLTFLRDHRTRQHYFNFSEDSDALTSRDLLVFAYCVARGMEYLTSKGIVHRDLAARNVLVDHNKLCKIADFGMSRNVREMGDVYEQRHSKGALPIRWMAPESLIYRIFTHKSDVWSFGILMWEIVTLGSTPYPQMGAREVMRRVCDGYRLERPSHCRVELFRIISWCWSADPNKRLDFSELKRELGVLLENSKNGTGYVDLESFEESKYNYSKTPVISHRHHHHHHHHHHQQQSSPSNHHSSPATATLRSIGDAEEIVVNM